MRLPKNFEDIRSSGLRRDYFMQELLNYVKPPGNLLDIGCGWGAFLANAREKGFTPYGVDVCHKAANFASTVLGIPTVCDQLDDCQFTEAMFDVLVVIHTLEHLMSPAAALDRMRKILKPGGVLAGIVPNIGGFCSLTMKEKWQWLDENTHYVHFTPETLKATLEKHGFEVLHLYTHTGDYDDPELRRLLGQRDDKDPNSEEINAAIKELWEKGQGEEIRFFAKAI
jgi:2-polyprenyl-3-methyl-5-hydroxy-6-metoxy-1,4-benzoquinol methylase